MANPKWLEIIENEIVLCLTPEVLTQIEQDRLTFAASRLIASPKPNDDHVIYRLNSRELLSLLATSISSKPAQAQGGAITIWTYYRDRLADSPIKPYSAEITPILQTVIYLDGDFHQRICWDILEHPLSDRICQAHGYVIGQISHQVVQAIANYIDEKLRPWTIATISAVTVFGWCDPLKALGQKLNLPDPILSNCWGMVITAPVVMLALLWMAEQLPWRLPPLPQKLAITGRNFGKTLLNFLESRFLQTLAIACITFMLASGALIYWADIPRNSTEWQIIDLIQDWIEPYLPIALISIRKRLTNLVVDLFRRYPLVIKLIFKRFLK